MTFNEVLDKFSNAFPFAEIEDFRPICHELFEESKEGITIWLKNGDMLVYYPNMTEEDEEEVDGGGRQMMKCKFSMKKCKFSDLEVGDCFSYNCKEVRLPWGTVKGDKRIYKKLKEGAEEIVDYMGNPTENDSRYPRREFPYLDMIVYKI